MEAPFLAGTPLGVPAMLDAACTVDMLNDAGLYAPGFAGGSRERRAGSGSCDEDL